MNNDFEKLIENIVRYAMYTMTANAHRSTIDYEKELKAARFTAHVAYTDLTRRLEDALGEVEHLKDYRNEDRSISTAMIYAQIPVMQMTIDKLTSENRRLHEVTKEMTEALSAQEKIE